MAQTTLAYISVGSNIDDREAYIGRAISRLAEHPSTHEIRASGLQRTVPVGMPEGTPYFLNGAICVETSESLFGFFELLIAIETELGRQTKGDYQPRSIDLDLVFWGEAVVFQKILQIPHPRYRERPFVLVPLLELDKDLVDPETGVRVDVYLADFEGP